MGSDTNPWTFCNYDDTNIGMFRDCGPDSYVAFEWTSRIRGGDTASFYIYTSHEGFTTTEEDYTNSTEDDGLIELVNLGWSPNGTLDECEGDCDSDSDCDGNMQCYHNGIPPGCYAANYTSGMDYCYDAGYTTTVDAYSTTEEESTSADTISCGETITGSVSRNESHYFTFNNTVSQEVTFTNCESDFDTKMYLIDSSGSFIQSQSTNNCDGDDCSDANYCSTSLRETFTMDPLSVGTYTLQITPWSSGGNYEVEAICANSFSTTEDYGFMTTEEESISTMELMSTVADTEWEATSTETFDGVNMEIGWIQYSHCMEGDNANLYNQDYSMGDLIEMAETAITVKIMPSGEIPGQSETASYTVMADLCSNPIYALNRGYTMSWQVDETSDPPVVTGVADTNNWIGATNLMWSSCYGDDSYGAEPSTLDHGYVYHACGNIYGLHIRHDEEDRCWFDWQTYTGHNISVWLGFDKYFSDRYCDFDDAGDYSLMFHVGDSASNASSSSSIPSSVVAMDWKWIEKEVQDHIPEEIPTVALLAFCVLCIVCCVFFQCCCRRKTKEYKRVGFEDEMPSDTDTDCDAAQPMNL